MAIGVVVGEAGFVLKMCPTLPMVNEATLPQPKSISPRKRERKVGCRAVVSFSHRIAVFEYVYLGRLTLNIIPDTTVG